MNDAAYMKSNSVAAMAQSRGGFGGRKMSMREEQSFLTQRYEGIILKYRTIG
jgi:hypothetical protein